jgi:ATP-dependent DNA ligase
MQYEPMKYSDGGMSMVDKLVKDDRWVFEQKMDGTRGLAVVTHDRPVWWPGRGGRGALAHSAATQHFPKINPVLQRIVGGTPGLLVIDGEIMVGSGEYHIWDIPYMRFGGVEVIRNEDTWERRHAALDAPDLIEMLADTPVKIVRTTRGWRDKAALLDAVAAEGGEGIMAKHTSGHYEPGKRVDHSVKVKFVKTAEVVVLTVKRPDPQHGSASLGVMAGDGKTIVAVGACSLIGKPEVKPGDVIEVNYLYWTGSSIYQPRMVKLRPDKVAADTDLAQFRSYSRRAV